MTAGQLNHTIMEDNSEQASVSSQASMRPLVSDNGDREAGAAVEVNIANDNDTSVGVDGENGNEDDDPILSKYHNACQRGDLEVVREMIHGGQVNVSSDADREGVTGLHWAAINNRLNVVDFLVREGANVESKAGALEATPLHWAARYGFVYVVDYLLQHGASATTTDKQGFNLLHLSVNSSNIMLVVYVLFFVVSKGIIDIDYVDPKGRTALLWAAYQGDSLTVAALIKFNASVKIADEGGFTPLHWGTVKGQPHVLKYLIQDGADFFQKTNDNKDCFVIAEEMSNTHSFQEALRHNNFDKNGYPINKLVKRDDHAKIITFLIPLLVLGFAFFGFSHLHILFALPVIILLLLASNKFIKSFLLPSYETKGTNSASLLKSPLIAGILFGSIFWLAFVWILRILPYTFTKRPLGNLTFCAILCFVCYSLFLLAFSDPGHIGSENDHEKIRETISNLLKEGKFDTRSFCLETWVRKPLRSKYSYLNDALILRFDHYCPWIYNDVGLKNHKLFIFFILALELGIFSFVKVCLKYFDELDMDGDCFILGDDDLCSGLIGDRFTFLIMTWACIQAVWIFSLVIVQLFQITKGLTNSELNALIREGRRVDIDSQTHNEFFNTVPEGFINNKDTEEEAAPPVRNNTNERISTTFSGNLPKPRTCMGMICAVTGLHQCVAIIKDTFGIARHGSSRSTNTRSLLSSISTDYGWRRNWCDFWLLSDTNTPLWKRIFFSPPSTKALLNGKEADYATLYEVPNKNHGSVSQLQELQDPLSEIDDMV